jgi:hypothetical protein
MGRKGVRQKPALRQGIKEKPTLGKKLWAGFSSTPSLFLGKVPEGQKGEINQP